MRSTSAPTPTRSICNDGQSFWAGSLAYWMVSVSPYYLQDHRIDTAMTGQCGSNVKVREHTMATPAQKVTALRTFFGVAESVPLSAALKKMHTDWGLDAEGSMPQQIDRLIAKTGALVPTTAPATATAATTPAATTPTVPAPAAAAPASPPERADMSRRAYVTLLAKGGGGYTARPGERPPSPYYLATIAPMVCSFRLVRSAYPLVVSPST